MPNQESGSRYSKYSREELEKLLENNLSSQEEKLILDELSNRFKKELLDKVKPPEPLSAGCLIWPILIIGIIIAATIPEVRCFFGINSESCPSQRMEKEPPSFKP